MKRLFAFMLALICILGLFGGTAVLAEEEKKVGKIEIAVEPDKTEYWIGEEFDPTGGVILVTYKDKTTAEVPMTDPGVDLPNVKTNSVGRKSVKISYGGKNATFYITVAEKGAEVAFQLNYDGAPEAERIAAKQGKGVSAPADPIREGYTFDGWYADAACTVRYDFSTVVTEPFDVFAFWKEDGETYHEVTYDLNYYGVLPAAYVQSVKDDESARALGLTPERSEFAFGGWFADAACTVPFAQDQAIAADTTVYAQWTKQKNGASTYVFEAEQTSLLGKEGPGMSGSASGASMIVNDATGLSASNGKYVSYLYKQGLSLEFYLASSEEAEATLSLSVAAEMDNIAFTSETYLVEVNGEALAYPAVALPSGGTFADAIVIEHVKLKEGANLIRLVTNNSVNPMGEGMGTYQGTAPMVDCIRLDTEAVVIWDANERLPMQY